jgi:NNP family nitrate/nitrite transporter-like MFS transporter
MVVPGCLFLVIAVVMKLNCWDTPTKPRFNVSDTGKTTKASMWDYVECLKDPRIDIMILQYGACFGTELVMNAQLATHFRVYFQMNAGSASALAGSFGMMNLFARSLGGIFSDFLFAKFGFPGRIWAQFICLFFEGIFLFAFGSVDDSNEWYVALAVLLCFSLFVQMTEGTSYGIVPFMNPKQLACTSALVGAGGNLGAVIALWCFYKQLGPIDTLLPFKVHGAYVVFWSLTSPAFWWEDKGGMFCGPKEEAYKKPGSKDDSSSKDDVPAA